MHGALNAKLPAYTKVKRYKGTTPSCSAKTLSCDTSPRACTPYGTVKLAYPEATQKAYFMAIKQSFSTPTTQGVGPKPKGVMSRQGPLNSNHVPDLREYLSSKRKLLSNEITNISRSQCGQVGYKLVTVHSVQCCLGSIHTTLCEGSNDHVPYRQSVFDRLSSTSKR